MKPWILLRVASVLTLIFCAGHTYGALGSSSRDPEQAAVFMAMQAFPFEIIGGQTHALAVLPRVQPSFQRDPAAARRAAVATGWPRETQPGRHPAASRFPLSLLPGIHDPLRDVFLLCARGVFRGGGDLPRPRVHLHAEYLTVFLPRALAPREGGCEGLG